MAFLLQSRKDSVKTHWILRVWKELWDNDYFPQMSTQGQKGDGGRYYNLSWTGWHMESSCLWPKVTRYLSIRCPKPILTLNNWCFPLSQINGSSVELGPVHAHTTLVYQGWSVQWEVLTWANRTWVLCQLWYTEAPTTLLPPWLYKGELQERPAGLCAGVYTDTGAGEIQKNAKACVIEIVKQVLHNSFITTSQPA